MERELAERRAALRSLLIEQVESTAPDRVRSAPTRRGSEPGRLRMVLVTAAVAVAVLVATVVALQVTRPSANRVAAPVTIAAPTAPAPTATPSPTPSLIAPTGWREITRTELHAFVAGDPTLQRTSTHGAVYEEQAWLEIRCMAGKGFVYDPIESAGSDSGALPGLSEEQVQRYGVAMSGETSSGTSRWQDAGCHGLAVHETGQDYAN